MTTAFGTAADTIADVTGAFSQTILNNNFASVIRYCDRLYAALRANGIIG